MKEGKKSNNLFWFLLVLVVVGLGGFLIGTYSDTVSFAPRAASSQVEAFQKLSPAEKIDEYLRVYSKDADKFTDRQILSLYELGKSKLNSKDRSALDSFTDEQVLDVAKGTANAGGIVGALTGPELEAGGNLAGGLMEELGQNTAFLGLCTDSCDGEADGCHPKKNIVCENGKTIEDCKPYVGGAPQQCDPDGCTDTDENGDEFDVACCVALEL